jgi:hypothetical protein
MSEGDKEENSQAQKPQYETKEQRSILLKGLSDRVVHRDITDVIRGGQLLDIYLRPHDRSASVSFVEGSAAQAFLNYTKRKDIYLHGKRVSLMNQPTKRNQGSFG